MVFAWFGAIFIGLSLGLLGSGGSILTVPMLVYVVGQEEKVAIAGSLLIVAVISFFSAIPYARQNKVDWRSVVMFGIPGMVGAVGGAAAARYVDSATQMLIFSSLMLAAAYLMFKPVKLDDAPHEPRAAWKIASDGLVVGAVTGIVGVGGGFLIIPALVLLGGLSMGLAVGTSLVIITLKSLAGFYEYLYVLEELDLTLDWEIIGIFSVLGVLGGWIGGKIGGKLPQQTLRRVFAVFLVLMGLYILYKNLPLLFA